MNNQNQSITDMDDEQLPIAPHKQRGARHFLGLYAAEHVAATEFVIGAAFVALGATIYDILIGLMIGNILAVLSFWLITTPIAVKTRLSLYTYIDKYMGERFSRFYNGANVAIFTAISAAMITVSATAVRTLFDIPPQTHSYPTSIYFIFVAIAVGTIVVVVAYKGFNVVADFASICAPWLMLMFTAGGMILIPALNYSLNESTTLSDFSDFINLAGTTVFTGINSEGQPGIGIWEVIGFAWAANTFAHFGLVDMALLRYAKKTRYGICTATGMMFGHYVAWISAALMGAATAAIMKTSIAIIEPGDVAWYALGATGFVIVIVAGWTTANSNLYRAGLAAQAVLPTMSRTKVTLLVGIAVVVASCFPFVYRNILPLLTYAGLILVPIGGIVFAEQHIFPKIGYNTNWFRLKGIKDNTPALLTWAISLIFGFALNFLNVIPFYYLFLPTWLVSITAYILLAKRHGAADRYPEAEKHLAKQEQEIQQYHLQLEKEDASQAKQKDTSVLSKLIRATWIIIGIVVPAVLAWRVLFNSPDISTYYENREVFYNLAIWCTVIYFVFAWWDLQRSKKLS